MVSLELRVSAVTDRADVVLPVAAVAEKAGTFVNWEGRPGSFGAALAVPGARVGPAGAGALADEMDVHLGLPDVAAARRELNALVPDVTSSFPRSLPRSREVSGPSSRQASASGRASASAAGTGTLQPGPGQAFLATWHNLLDAGRMQDGDQPVHSFRTLLQDLATLTRNTVRLGDAPPAAMLAKPTPLQQEVFDKLEVPLLTL